MESDNSNSLSVCCISSLMHVLSFCNDAIFNLCLIRFCTVKHALQKLPTVCSVVSSIMSNKIVDVLLKRHLAYLLF